MSLSPVLTTPARRLSAPDGEWAPNGLFALSDKDKQTILDFHKLFYDTIHWVRWFGAAIQKNPVDLWVYQEIIAVTQPDLLIEIGTNYGGSSVYFATLFEFMDNGHVITIDTVEKEDRPRHARLTQFIGDSVSPDIIERLKVDVRHYEKVMVVIDGDHDKDQVLKELELYAPLVSEGSYLVVEDTNLGHEVVPDWDGGPREALDEWLPSHPEFTVDARAEYLYLTYNPGGWLFKGQLKQPFVHPAIHSFTNPVKK